MDIPPQDIVLRDGAWTDFWKKLCVLQEIIAKNR